MYPLTREKVGISAAGILAVILIIYLAGRYCNYIDSKMSRVYILACIELVLFCAAHIYMYLFVFDEYEAKDLLEFDRYICQYLAGFFMFSICMIMNIGDKLSEKTGIKINLSFIIILLLLALLPYKSMSIYLIPHNYDEYYDDNMKDAASTAQEEYAASDISDINNNGDGGRLMLMANAWDIELQYFDYYAAPNPVQFVANIPAIENGKLKSFVETQMEDNDINYIYVLNNAVSSYTGNWDKESSELNADGVPLLAGHIYKSQKGGTWKMKLIR